MRTFIISVALGLALPSYSWAEAIHATRYKDDLDEVTSIWTEILKHPKLVFTPIQSVDERFIGTWQGTYKIGSELKKGTITLEKNGVWKSGDFLPDGSKGTWKLYDGILLLYWGDHTQKDGRCWSALTYSDKQLRLFYVDVQGHLIHFSKHTK